MTACRWKGRWESRITQHEAVCSLPGTPHILGNAGRGFAAAGPSLADAQTGSAAGATFTGMGTRVLVIEEGIGAGGDSSHPRHPPFFCHSLSGCAGSGTPSSRGRARVQASLLGLPECMFRHLTTARFFFFPVVFSPKVPIKIKLSVVSAVEIRPT